MSADGKPPGSLAPHQIAAIQHSFGGSLKVPVEIKQMQGSIHSDEHGVSSTTPLAPHQVAAIQHSFGGNLRIPIDIEKWRASGNITNEDEVTSTTGPDVYKRNNIVNSKPFWRPGAYPVSGQSSGLSRTSSHDDLTSVTSRPSTCSRRTSTPRNKS